MKVMPFTMLLYQCARNKYRTFQLQIFFNFPKKIRDRLKTRNCTKTVRLFQIRLGFGCNIGLDVGPVTCSEDFMITEQR